MKPLRSLPRDHAQVLAHLHPLTPCQPHPIPPLVASSTPSASGGFLDSCRPHCHLALWSTSALWVPSTWLSTALQTSLHSSSVALSDTRNGASGKSNGTLSFPWFPTAGRAGDKQVMGMRWSGTLAFQGVIPGSTDGNCKPPRTPATSVALAPVPPPQHSTLRCREARLYWVPVLSPAPGKMCWSCYDACSLCSELLFTLMEERPRSVKTRRSTHQWRCHRCFSTRVNVAPVSPP